MKKKTIELSFLFLISSFSLLFFAGCDKSNGKRFDVSQIDSQIEVPVVDGKLLFKPGVITKENTFWGDVYCDQIQYFYVYPEGFENPPYVNRITAHFSKTENSDFALVVLKKQFICDLMPEIPRVTDPTGKLQIEVDKDYQGLHVSFISQNLKDCKFVDNISYYQSITGFDDFKLGSSKSDVLSLIQKKEYQIVETYLVTEYELEHFSDIYDKTCDRLWISSDSKTISESNNPFFILDLGNPFSNENCVCLDFNNEILTDIYVTEVSGDFEDVKGFIQKLAEKYYLDTYYSENDLLGYDMKPISYSFLSNGNDNQLVINVYYKNKESEYNARIHYCMPVDFSAEKTIISRVDLY